MTVRFANNKVKKKYKRHGKKHSWRMRSYTVIQFFSYSESSISHALLVNDKNELWFVDTRDIRVNA